MNCLICNETLTEANASDEHIILNSLGGHLHSKDLLCKKCNNKFGKEADAALADTLKFAASQLDVKRYRGENQVIQTSEKEKYDLAPGCKPVLKKPEVRVEKLPDGKMQIEMSARSTQEARKILKSLQRQYPMIDVDEAMRHAQKKQSFIGTPVKMNIAFEGEKIFPSIVKTAVEFYLLRGGAREEIKSLIPHLLGEEKRKVCWYFYPEKPVFSFKKKEICHAICVVGDAEQRILYGYVDLFGILQCLVLLSDCYSGKNYMESYVYDVNEGKEINKTPAIRLERDEIQKIVRGTESSWVEGLLRQTRLFHEKAGEIVKERILDGMWQRIMDQSLGKYPEGVLITEEMLGEVLAEMEKEMIPWYVSRICGTDL